MSSTLALRLGGTTTLGPDRFRGPQFLVVVAVSVFALLSAAGAADARPIGPGHDPAPSKSAANEAYSDRLQGLADALGGSPASAVAAIADGRALNAPGHGEVAGGVNAAGDGGTSIAVGAGSLALLVLAALIVGVWLALDRRRPSTA